MHVETKFLRLTKPVALPFDCVRQQTGRIAGPTDGDGQGALKGPSSQPAKAVAGGTSLGCRTGITAIA
jgi:hypothetical protein